MKLISKTKYIAGRQCLKLLWHHYNAPDAFPEIDASTQAHFDEGTKVGTLAQSLFPDGIAVDCDHSDFAEVLKRSRNALDLRKPLFEAGFSSRNGFARADILNPTGRDGWEIIEVKMSTEVKDVHLEDIAFQKNIFENAGLKIRDSFALHINNEYVRKTKLDPSSLFVQEKVSAHIHALVNEVPKALAKMIRTIQSAKCPEVQIGDHCNNPYPCPLQERCWAHVPKLNVLELYRGGKKARALFDSGCMRQADIPKSFALSKRQEIQVEASRTGKPYVDKKAIARFLSNLVYPLSFLDFETFQTAIPMFRGTKPYQQIPFQFSLHTLESPRDEPKHEMFLADGDYDPRPEFMSRLKSAMGPRGSILVYNASFEKSRLRECAKALPTHASWVKKLEERFVDLWDPFRNFDYYHPDQCGSASIKDVLPCLVQGDGYKDLEIADGGTASAEFMRITFDDVPKREKARIRRDLEHYCERDTLAMLWIVRKLASFI